MQLPKNNISITLILLTVFLSLASQAQSIQVDRNLNFWSNNFLLYSLNDKWKVGTELHVRRTEGFKYWQQFLFRPLLAYSPNKNIELAGGYTYIQSWPYGSQPIPIKTPENNIWEQVSLNHESGNVNFAHRFRYEQRFTGLAVSNLSGIIEIDGFRFSQRFRYRFLGVIPFFKSKKFFLSWFDEVFINMNNNLMPFSFSQNWLYGGIGYKFSTHGNVQLGYMQQAISKGNGINYENNSTIQLFITYTLSKSKKEEK